MTWSAATSQGVRPWMDLVSGSALHSSSVATTSRWPCEAAANRGVSPIWSYSLGSARASNSRVTSARSPRSTAWTKDEVGPARAAGTVGFALTAAAFGASCGCFGCAGAALTGATAGLEAGVVAVGL